MARTDAGRLLTEQHRRSQLQVRARALRDYLRLWPIWEGDEESFIQMAFAVIVLIRAYHGLSASVAASYFQSFRLAEGVRGEAIARLAGPIDEGKVIAGLSITGRDAVRKALNSGIAPEKARETALVRTSGSVTRHVLNGGRETILRSVEEDREALGWARVTDADPCPFCQLLAGRGPVYKANTVGFEAHDHCVPAGTLVNGPLPELGFRRWYQGELVIIRLAGGRELSITPNHPVLTNRGWVEAGLLSEGDNVVQRAGADLDALRVPHEDDVPTPIEDVWGAPGMNWLRTVPISPKDFHGDGRGSQGNVEVKATDRFLSGMLDASLVQFSAEPVSPRTGPAAIARSFARKSNFAAMVFRLLTAAVSGVSIFGLRKALLGGKGRGMQDVRLPSGASLHPGFAQPPGDNSSTYPMSVGKHFLRDTGLVRSRDVGRGGHTVGAAASQLWPRFNPPLLESEPDLLRAKADLGSRLLKRLSGGIEFSRVVELRRVGSWSGHVYNLQTVEGWYDANGIVVSNCGCTVQPVYDRTSPWPGRAREFKDEYNEAILEAREAGELERGTSNDLLNAYRRFLERKRLSTDLSE